MVYVYAIGSHVYHSMDYLAYIILWHRNQAYGILYISTSPLPFIAKVKTKLTGLEPATDWLTANCSTTELQLHVCFLIYHRDIMFALTQVCLIFIFLIYHIKHSYCNDHYSPNECYRIEWDKYQPPVPCYPAE